MKRRIAILLTMLMLFNIAAVSPVMAVDVPVGSGYTLVDTCYSPELGMYVAVAKNLSGASTPGAILYSKTGEEWSVGRNINSAIHYANKPTRQTVVWWEKEHQFAAIMDTNVLTSPDGITWTIDSSLSGRANSIIETNGDQLVIDSRKTLRTFDDINTPVIDETFATNDIYGKTVGVTSKAPYTYVVMDRNCAYTIVQKSAEESAETAAVFEAASECDEAVDGKEDLYSANDSEQNKADDAEAAEPMQEDTEQAETEAELPYEGAESDAEETAEAEAGLFAADGEAADGDFAAELAAESSITVTTNTVTALGDNPYDMIYNEQMDGWFVIDGKSGLKLFNRDTRAFTVLNRLSLDDGTTTASSECFTAAAVNNDFIIVGMFSGSLYAAPNTEEAIKADSEQWVQLTPGAETGKITEEIRSITALDDGTFFFATATHIYAAVNTEEGWKYYDPAKSEIMQGEITRIEVPETGSVTEDIIPRSITWNGRTSVNEITSVEIIDGLAEGITSESISDGIRLTVDSTVQGGHDLELKVTAKNGQTKSFIVTVVNEDRLDIDGFSELTIPDEGEGSKQYAYSAVVIGTDGKPMAREAEMRAVELQDGVEFDPSGGILTVHEGAGGGKLVFEVYKKGNPEDRVLKEITLTPKHAAIAEISSGAATVRIPDSGTAQSLYTAVLFNQVHEEMPKERIEWRVEPKNISTMDGITINAASGELNITPGAYAGTIIVKALAVSDNSVFAEKEVTLTYTEQRMALEDLRAVNIDPSVPVEKNLELKTTGEYESIITWRSSDESLLKPDGTVIRPSREDKTVTLIGTSQLNGKKAGEKYELTIKKADNLCLNGDLSNGTYDGWIPKNNTVLTVEQENGTNVLHAVGEGAYQEVTFTNNSSFGFEASVKGSLGSKIRLVSEIGGTIAEITANGTYKDIKGSYDYRKQKDSFTDKIYLECDGEMTVDYMKIYEITLELDAVTAAVNKAVYSRSQTDIDSAKALLNGFYDLPVRDELYNTVNKITAGGAGGSGSGGGSGGSGGSGSKNNTAPTNINSSVNNISIPNKPEDNYSDELDTYLLRFKDMKNHWAREDVEYMGQMNIINGNEDGSFLPDNNISRAEFAVLAARTMGLGETPYENSFFDVVSEDWYSGYVQTMRSNDFMNGYDGLFNPNSPITREEIAKVIVAAYNSKTNTKTEKGRSLYFNDLDDISYWAYDYISEAVELGFVNGVTEELFAPKAHATRAQAAVMLRRVYDKLNPEDDN